MRRSMTVAPVQQVDASTPIRPRFVRPRTRRRRRLPTAWPLAALLLGYPLWWGLGIGELVWTLFAIPMLLQLRNRRPVRLPPMFWVWGLFLTLVCVSAVMLDVQANDTIPTNAGGGNIIAFAIRLLNYLSVTVVLVYIGNLSPRSSCPGSD